MSEFLAMGGYAAYVWSAFSIALVLMVALFLESGWAARRRLAELEELRAKARPQRRTAGPMRPRKESEDAGARAPVLASDEANGQ